MISSFDTPQTVVTGAGCRSELSPLLRRGSVKHVLLVTDPYIESSGIADDIRSIIRQSGTSCDSFAGVQPDPTDGNVAAGVSALRSGQAELVIGLGGGSALDAAKAIAFAGYHQIPRAGVPMIAIPTTAGTGSEVTKVAVITDTQNHTKLMMLDRHLLPQAAIVDFELSMSMPAALTANVGVDTLTHAIEAYVSRKANGMTDPIALSAIKLVATHLRTAVAEPDNRGAREGMMLAACQGGMAFANSSVCLVHGMSRPIGALYHVPHGLSNAVLLPTVTAYSLSGAITRYATVARQMGLANEDDHDHHACERLVTGLQALNQDLAIPSLGEVLGCSSTFEQRLAKMADDALASGSPQNNPVVPDAATIARLYQEAW